MIKALRLIMGSEFKQLCKSDRRSVGLWYNSVDELLPYQIWDKCRVRVEEQHFDGGSNLKNDLHALEFEIADDMAKFKEEFVLNLAGQIV